MERLRHPNIVEFHEALDTWLGSSSGDTLNRRRKIDQSPFVGGLRKKCASLLIHVVADQKVDIRPRFIESLLFCLWKFFKCAKETINWQKICER